MNTATDAAVEGCDRDLLVGLLGEMLRIRRFEEKAGQLYGLRKIGGFCHLYIGQEAVAVGAISAIDLAVDHVLTAYRDHGHALACGMDPGAAMAELLGKAAGCSRGKGGSMHLFDVGRHFWGGNGIVGAHIPVATGAALALRYREEAGVVLCFFGDGAIHQGSFHESANLAKIWGLPIVYICENNQYGMGTFYKRVSAVEDFSVLAGSYGFPGRRVDGMDVLAVREAVAEAAGRAREEKTPTLLEARTYRYRGHSMSDPARYRTKEELNAYKQQDPIEMFAARLKAAGVLSDEGYDELDAAAKAAVAKAVAFAEAAAPPEEAAMYEDIYAPAGPEGG